MSVIHIQQGGSSTELYVHMHGDQDEADECRANCAKDGYRVSNDIKTRCKLTDPVIRLIDEIVDEAAELMSNR